METNSNSDWRAPQPWNWRKAALPALSVLCVALAAALIYVLTRPEPAPPAAPTGPVARPLNSLETAGLQALLSRQQSGAHKLSGTVTDTQGRQFGVQLSMTGASTAGVGTVTAGSTRGEALLDRGEVYLRGEQEFWAAMGVTGTVPPPPGWVAVGGEFLGGKLFMAPTKWTAALAPSAAALIEGDRYTQGQNSALIGPTDITHVNVDGMNVDISPTAAQAVTDEAAPLIAGRGTPPALNRTANGGWLLSTAAAKTPAPEAPEASTEPSTPESAAPPTP